MTQALRSLEAASTIAYGRRIRDLRRKADITLQRLADTAGISVGFLSQVERDKATPSITTLTNIAQALDVDIEVFISQPSPEDSLTRQADRPRLSPLDTSVFYEKLTTTLPGSALTSVIIHIPEGFETEATAHGDEEVLFILEGMIEHRVGEVRMELGVGDAMHFMNDAPNYYANIGKGPARLLWTGTNARLARLKDEANVTLN